MYTGHQSRSPSGSVIREDLPFAAIEFVYEDAPIPFSAFIAGRVFEQRKRLVSIESRVNPERGINPNTIWSSVSRYQISYVDRPTVNRFTLARIIEFGEDGSSLAPTEFRYTDGEPGWSQANYSLPIGAIAGASQLGNAYRFVRFARTSGQRPDMLFAARVEGRLEAFAFENGGNGTWTSSPTFAPPFAFTTSDGQDLGAVLVDVNGDGRIDLLQSYADSNG